MQTEVFVYQLGTGGYVEQLHGIGASWGLNDVQKILPDGVYTTFRTYKQTNVVRLEEHFYRLEESAYLLSKHIRLDRKSICAALASIISTHGFIESRIRICVDLQATPGAVYLLIEPLTTPSLEQYEIGVRVVTQKFHRENPRAKSTLFVQKADLIRAHMADGINEIIMVDDQNHFLEGLSSNFFAVSDGIIYTPEEGVLFGVTRALVIDVIGKLGIHLKKTNLPINEIANFTEAFITSSSRGVLPVNQIDQVKIGDGKPGLITDSIRKNFDRLIEEIMQPIIDC